MDPSANTAVGRVELSGDQKIFISEGQRTSAHNVHNVVYFLKTRTVLIKTFSSQSIAICHCIGGFV